MRMIKFVPNILTLTRVIFTMIYLLMLYDLHLYGNSGLYFILAVLVFIIICVTDLLDGKIARKMQITSSLGGLLDVSADFIFIVSSLIMLSIYNMIPRWFIVLVLVKFIEFTITSYIIGNHKNGSNAFFIFDCFGRAAAVNFFLAPGIVLLSYVGLKIMFINIFLYITIGLVLISSSARCINCYKVLKVRKETDVYIDTLFKKSS